MSVFNKLQTLLRANLRESVEQVTEANAVRIYRQEIIEAEALLAQRRDCLAASIATRKDLEQDIEQLERRIDKRTTQVQSLPDAERGDTLLQMAAAEIAGWESQQEHCKRRHVALCEDITREELTLRTLLGEIREHRREIRLLDSQVRRRRGTSGGNNTVSGRLAALRETRAAISGGVRHDEQMEAGMKEAIDRVEGSAVDRELAKAGRDPASLRVAQVLNRLNGLGASA